MNLAIIRKTISDYALIWLGALVLLTGFVILFVFATHSVPMEQGREWIELPWVRAFLQAMVGADMAEGFTPNGITSFAFSHPFTWVVLVTFMLTLTSGVLVGEVDRGTMDLLAGLPVSRVSIYASVSGVILLMGLPLCWAMWSGVAFGRRVVGGDQISMEHLQAVAWHLYVTYVYVACFGMAVSAISKRRGNAIAFAFAAIFGSFVLNFLCALWPAARKVEWLSFLHFYTPLPIARTGEIMQKHMLILLIGAAAWWTLGLIVFCRRDIHAA